jgi:23S rRNA pseudouridine1911/1915/1917 synthase
MPEIRRPLLEWVLEKFPDTPKKRAKQWILSGRVSVGGKILRKPNEILREVSQKIELLERKSASKEFAHALRIHPKLELLYFDASLAVVVKDAGLLSVPDASHRTSALEILRGFLRKQSRNFVTSAVHRLDQFTSGVMCFALNPTARAHLIEQFKTHSITREYIAFVEGRPKSARGTWKHWLKLSEDGLRQYVSTTKSGAELAITHYEIIEEFEISGRKFEISKLKLRLETGLKHQIRVQAAHEGVPLIGDRAYNPHYREGKNVPILFPRQALHAEFLELEHPAQRGRHMSWRAPLPKDLQKLEAQLKAGAVSD